VCIGIAEGLGPARGRGETADRMRDPRTSMILEPASSCMTRPDVTMGEMPSSMHVPRLEAMITRAQ